MGIRGLRTFVQRNGILLPFCLKSTKVIIDGNNICHQLLFEGSCRDYGGDYEKLKRETMNFFRHLLQCNVHPYVVFDGAHDDDDKKLIEIQRKCEARINELENPTPKNMACTPILMYETFKMALKEIKVPHVACEGEADNQIAILANHWKCPIISCDSDMYIFDLPGGVIHLKDMWPNHNNDDEINTQIYFASTFEKMTRLPVSLLPLAATILGNPYIEIGEQIADCFIRRLGGRSHVSGFLRNLGTFFDLLLEARDKENGLKILLECADKTLSEEKSCEIKKKINTSVNFYNVKNESESNIANYFAGQKETRHHWSLPDRVIQDIRSCRMSGFPIDVVTGRVILKPTLEQYDLPPVQQICLPVRQAVYGIVLKSCSSDKSDSTIVEMIRDKRQMTQKRVSPKYDILGYGRLPTLQYIDKLDKNRKLKLLAAIFCIQPEMLLHIPEESKLFILALNYFVDHGLDESEVFHYKSYILCHIVLLNKDNKDISRTAHQRLSSSCSDTCRDIRVFHVYLQQFHECLNMAYTINAFLGTPLKQPDPTTVYDGKLMYNFIYCNRSKEQVERTFSECFTEYPPLRRLVDRLTKL